MAISIFKDLIEELFQGVVLGQYERINGLPEAPNYLHDQYLDSEYSVDMTYNSLSGDYTRIMADVVSFDSPLPIKSRGAIRSAAGSIPKIGVKYTLNEKEMNTLRILRNTPGRAVELARKVFADAESAMFGIKERLEQAFLLGLSSGVTLISDADNAGLAVRIDYNVPAGNQSGVPVVWSDPAANIIDDIRASIKTARNNGHTVRYLWMNADTMANFYNNTQAKELFAFNQNFVGVNVPQLDDAQVQSVLTRTLGIAGVIVVDRTFTEQKDATKTITEGWTPNMVVLTTSTQVGTLVYSTLAEEEFPQEHVQYAKPNDYILISKSGQDDPVSEKTMGQAIAFPILKDVESLYYIDTNTVEA